MKTETIVLKIIRTPIGGGFHVCNKKCSFYKRWVTGHEACTLINHLLDLKLKNKPVSQCSNLMWLHKNYYE